MVAAPAAPVADTGLPGSCSCATPTLVVMPEHVPGWYPDPAPYAPAGQQRYWDGTGWRPQVRADRPAAGVEPGAGSVAQPVSGSVGPVEPYGAGIGSRVPVVEPVEPYVAPVRPLYVVPDPAAAPAGRRVVPLWVKIAVPALVAVAAGGIAAAGSGGEPSPTAVRTVATTAATAIPATTTARPATTAAPVAPAVAAAPVATTVPATAAPATTAPTTTPSSVATPTTAPPTTTPPVVGSVPAGGTTDRRYSTCKEAKSHGLGPYYRGRDVEYDWYRDADSDGIVCE